MTNGSAFLGPVVPVAPVVPTDDLSSRLRRPPNSKGCGVSTKHGEVRPRRSGDSRDSNLATRSSISAVAQDSRHSISRGSLVSGRTRTRLGVDASTTAAAAARDGAARHGVSNVRVVTAAADDVDLSVRAAGRHLRAVVVLLPPDPAAVLASCRRTSSGPGGVVAVIDYWHYLAIRTEPRSPLFDNVFRRRVPKLRRRRRIARRRWRAAPTLRGGRAVGASRRAGVGDRPARIAGLDLDCRLSGAVPPDARRARVSDARGRGRLSRVVERA